MTLCEAFLIHRQFINPECSERTLYESDNSVILLYINLPNILETPINKETGLYSEM